MSRRKPDPDAELAALHDKRVGLAIKRATFEDAERAWQGVLGEAPDRRRAVLLAEARGETPSETVEQVEADRRKAEVEIAGCRERSVALQTVEKEIEGEVEAVIDASPAHFIAKAEAASEGAQEALAAAAQAAQGASTAWADARAAWSTVRLSRRRRRLELTPETGLNDLGGAINELSKVHPGPWPGGSREAYERFVAYEAREKAPVSNAQALAAFERIGS